MTSLDATFASASSAQDVLVERARTGDREAFDRLTRSCIEGAYRTALAIVRSEADARDVVQDAFVTAWRELPQLRDVERFDAWLGRIVANGCRSLLRHRRVVDLRIVATIDDPDAADRPAADPRASFSEALVEADAIRRAFERLRPDDRILIVLHHVDGRMVSDIARVLGIPEGTAKWRLHEARAALGRYLEDERR